MKKIITLLCSSIFLFSCGKNNVEYLYSEYDGQDYRAALAAQQKQCENKNKIFTTLDETSNFNNYFKDKSIRVFKITRKYTEDSTSVESLNDTTSEDDNGTSENEESASGAQTQIIYLVMKKNTLSQGSVQINITHNNHNPSNTEFKDKKILYTQQMNKDILSTAITGACSDKYPSVIGKDFFRISDVRKKTISEEPKIYNEFGETLNFYPGLPAFMARWNGKVVQNSQNEYNKITKTWEAPDGIKEISVNDCSDSYCKKALNDQTLPECDLVVNTNHYESDVPEQMLTSFEGCLAE